MTPTGTLTERRNWYLTAPIPERCAALRNERSPKILETVIPRTQPNQRDLLLVVCELSHQPRREKYGNAISRGILSLARKWAEHPDENVFEAVEWLVNEDNIDRGLNLFFSLWDTVDRPHVVDRFAHHPNAEIRTKALSSSRISEASLLAAAATSNADPTAELITTTVAQNTSQAFTPRVVEALLRRNEDDLELEILANRRTPAHVAANIIVSLIEKRDLRRLYRRDMPFIAHRRNNLGPEAAAARESLAAHLLNMTYPTMDAVEKKVTATLLTNLLNTEPTGIDSTTTLNLIARWLPILSDNADGSQARFLLTEYAKHLEGSFHENLPTPEAMAVMLAATWTQQSDNLGALYSRDLAELIHTGLLPVAAAKEAIAALPATTQSEPRIAAIRQVQYPITAVADYIDSELSQHHALIRLVSTDRFETDNYLNVMRDDIDTIIPLLSRKRDVREELAKWMSRLGGLDETPTLEHLATNNNVAIRRITASCLQGHTVIEPKRSSWGITRVMSDETKRRIDTNQRKVLLDMLQDPDAMVRRNAVLNPLLTMNEVIPLRNDSNAQVRTAAGRRFMEGLAL